MKTLAKCGVIALALILGSLTIWGLAVAARNSEQQMAIQEQAQYSGWSKLHPEAKLTFEEWWYLRQGDMLPEQSGKRLQAEAGEDAFAGGIVGGMLGSQLGK